MGRNKILKQSTGKKKKEGICLRGPYYFLLPLSQGLAHREQTLLHFWGVSPKPFMAAQKTRRRTPQCDVSSMLRAKGDSAWLGVTHREKHRLRGFNVASSHLGRVGSSSGGSSLGCEAGETLRKKKADGKAHRICIHHNPKSALWEGGARQIT